MPPLSLRDLQAGFWRSLHRGEVAPTLVASILPSAELDPEARIAIYQTMYFWRLFEVLREDYPKTHGALGDVFETVVRRYLSRHPSERPSVRHLGRRLPAFLEGDRATNARPWLADLARLELARTDVFDAPDATPIRATDLCAVPPEDWAALRFEVIPAVEVLHSRWPIHESWACPTRADVPPQPTVLRVWRQDFQVFHAIIDPMEDSAFSALRSGAPFEAVCEAVAAHVGPEAAPADAGSLLARWIENGLLTRLAS